MSIFKLALFLLAFLLTFQICGAFYLNQFIADCDEKTRLAKSACKADEEFEPSIVTLRILFLSWTGPCGGTCRCQK